MSVPVLLRVAAFLHWFIAVGFGVFCVPAIRNLLSGRDIPIVMGFPAYGRGPFERAGIPTTVPLLAAFLLVCILEAIAGFLLWRGSFFSCVTSSSSSSPRSSSLLRWIRPCARSCDGASRALRQSSSFTSRS